MLGKILYIAALIFALAVIAQATSNNTNMTTPEPAKETTTMAATTTAASTDAIKPLFVFVLASAFLGLLH
ncbi:hypothetical protein [Bacteroides sp. 51]|uniref:hypothetical protein n=1 Tax=Bacteroides sp. 51 TaxID=2302938 RepID=UPI0013D0003B|nr:hypothetical protein [Bacteroides sp. 51]NDV85027.1 hypothetical protein [Bacteroides sp. 51]